MLEEGPLSSLDLHKKDAHPDPFKQFARWFQEAKKAVAILPEAVAVATADGNGTPSVRMVLLKHFDAQGFVFYTNYGSRKGTELAKNPKAAMLFHWQQLARQISIRGSVIKMPQQESLAYFRTRPRNSQLAALASKQSQVISTRQELEQCFDSLLAQYEGKEVPLPAGWGGFRLRPESIEFWQNRDDRLHDRLFYTLDSEGKWRIDRLSP